LRDERLLRRLSCCDAMIGKKKIIGWFLFVYVGLVGWLVSTVFVTVMNGRKGNRLICFLSHYLFIYLCHIPFILIFMN